MDPQALQRRRAERAHERRRRRRRRRLAALGTLTLVAVVAVVAAVTALTGGGSAARRSRPGASASASSTITIRAGKEVAGAAAGPPASPELSVHIGPATGHPGDVTAPILMYHVINPPPPGAPYPGLYVPRAEFAGQMRALKSAGYHPVTLDELRDNWTHGNRLPRKPIIISFDNGYRSQYTNAMPILRRLGWPAVLNAQLSGLPPSQGGLTTAQFRGLIGAGWELDTQGMSHADLVEQDAVGLRFQIDHARTVLRRRFHVPVDWFCYPSGQYDPTVVAAVRAAGFVGSTTVVPGWAGRVDSPYALPRLRVLGGTSPAQLLAEIAEARDDPTTPSLYETS